MLRNILVLSFAIMSCNANDPAVQKWAVMQRAPADLECVKDDVKVLHLGGDHYQARGCGQKVNYDVNGICSARDNCSASQEGSITKTKSE